MHPLITSTAPILFRAHVEHPEQYTWVLGNAGKEPALVCMALASDAAGNVHLQLVGDFTTAPGLEAYMHNTAWLRNPEHPLSLHDPMTTRIQGLFAKRGVTWKTTTAAMRLSDQFYNAVMTAIFHLMETAEVMCTIDTTSTHDHGRALIAAIQDNSIQAPQAVADYLRAWALAGEHGDTNHPALVQARTDLAKAIAAEPCTAQAGRAPQP